MVRPAMDLIGPHLAPGAVICADNTVQARDGYADFFAFLAEPEGRFRTLTLPFEGGFENDGAGG